jgi:hypothetical protein
MIGASGGPVGAIIGVAVGWAVGKCFEFFKSVWQDDVFTPTTGSGRGSADDGMLSARRSSLRV